MPKVFIAALVRNCAWILGDWLSHARAISGSKFEKEYGFIVNDSTDETEAMVREFAERERPSKTLVVKYDFGKDSVGAGSSRLNAADPLERGDEELGSRLKLFENLAILRNIVLDTFLAHTDAEWLCSVDADVMIPPDALDYLLDDPEPKMRAGLIINDYLFNKYPFSEFYNRHINAGVTVDRSVRPDSLGKPNEIRNFLNYRLGKVYPVDAAGACFVLHRSLAERARYRYHLWGEDAGFCADLKKSVPGVRIELDTRVVPFHVMHHTMIRRHDEFKDALCAERAHSGVRQ